MSHRGTYKEEPGVSSAEHHPHHTQGPATHLGHQPRPSSIVHHQQAPPAQHASQYPAHNLEQYPQAAPGGGPYYTQQPHQSPYSTPASGAYSSAEAADTMATAHMQRPGQYPPISYHTPQSNSPASVASPSGHDGQRSMYGGPVQQSQAMYGYPQQAYPPMPPQGAPAYSAHPQQHQQHPSMASQSNLLMSHAPGQHQMQHPSQGMTGSPRPKMEPHVPNISRPSAPLGPPQHPGTPQMNNQNVPGGGGNGVNPNAAPGPIPATTPLVVRQDNNGVQWIAFEYSRDRVKMEYTIRCDVESVNVDTLSPEFKQENCVYPRACCSKDQYRGNRLVYETECNTVGWALAELNPCLRGKRGLIQRAVDSWRNSNQDPRLRSRRVRRMAKINNRKAVSAATHPPHMAGPTGPPAPSMGPGAMGPGGNASMAKMGSAGGPQLHHHHQTHPDGSGGQGGDDGEQEYIADEHAHHHHQPSSSGAPSHHQPAPQEVRPVQQFTSPYVSAYPPPPPSLSGPSMIPQPHQGGYVGNATSVSAYAVGGGSSGGPLVSSNGKVKKMTVDEERKLFGDVPEGKKRKFILVDEPSKGRVRVRVTLDTVDTDEIPDSFRERNAVFPRSYYAVQMKDEGATGDGGNFDDLDDGVEVHGGRGVGTGSRKRFKASSASLSGKVKVEVKIGGGGDVEEGEAGVEVEIPRMRRSVREKEIMLNELGYRMCWHQSRVFADKVVFLQKALDSYRNKTFSLLEANGRSINETPHFETRVGKRMWNERERGRGKKGVNGGKGGERRGGSASD